MMPTSSVPIQTTQTCSVMVVCDIRAGTTQGMASLDWPEALVSKRRHLEGSERLYLGASTARGLGM